MTDIENLFKSIDAVSLHVCEHVNKKTDDKCGKKAKYKNIASRSYLCTLHYKSALKGKIKEHSPQLIKNVTSQKYPTAKLQLELINELDEIMKHWIDLGVEEIIIENQPTLKSPKMKAIASTLFDYFMIRGYVDKIYESNITLVRFFSPSNKLKVNADNTLEVFRINRKRKKR